METFLQLAKHGICLIGDHVSAVTVKNQVGFAEDQAAATRHTVIRNVKTIGRMKKYLQLKTVTAAKHRASAHAGPRSSAKVSAERPPSCHANTAANKRKTETNSPDPTKKSQ